MYLAALTAFCNMQLQKQVEKQEQCKLQIEIRDGVEPSTVGLGVLGE